MKPSICGVDDRRIVIKSMCRCQLCNWEQANVNDRIICGKAERMIIVGVINSSFWASTPPHVSYSNALFYTLICNVNVKIR